MHSKQPAPRSEGGKALRLPLPARVSFFLSKPFTFYCKKYSFCYFQSLLFITMSFVQPALVPSPLAPPTPASPPSLGGPPSLPPARPLPTGADDLTGYGGTPSAIGQFVILGDLFGWGLVSSKQRPCLVANGCLCCSAGRGPRRRRPGQGEAGEGWEGEGGAPLPHPLPGPAGPPSPRPGEYSFPSFTILFSH